MATFPPSAATRLLEELRRGRIDRREFLARAGRLGLGLSTVGMALAACGKKGPAPAAATEGAALGEIERELVIYNWSDYIAPETIAKFSREFGVQVRYETYESNEEMVARVAAGSGGYDLVVPTNYAVAVLASRALLAPLDPRYLPNLANLAPTFVNPVFDPGNVHSVAYQWGTTGIAYRSDRVSAPPASWGVFLDGRLRGRMTQMDDMRDVLGAWLRFRSKSLNSADPTDLAQARSDALAARKNLSGYVSAPVKPQLIAGSVWVAQLWNGDTAQAAAKDPQIRYVLPREGSSIWTDSLVIPASAPHKRAAHEFINYILRPEVGAEIANHTGYGSPNQAALASIARPIPFPTAEEFQRLEYERDLGDAGAMWDQVWNDVRG